MKIFITGGTGFIGTTLTNVLISKGHNVTVLDRNQKRGRPVPENVSRIEGDSTKTGAWQQKLAEHDTIINLAGTSIFQRWNSKVKKRIYDSRILTTKNVVEALTARKGMKTFLFSSSGVDYYGHSGDKILDETDPPGSDFLAKVATNWETEALKATDYGVRVVLCRFGIVLGRDGGALRRLIPIFKRYLGSPFGSGKQWFSWIHEDDLTNIVLFLLEKKDIDGPVNFAAPNPVRNEELTKILAEILGKPIIIPLIPGFMLKLFLGEFANVVLKGQNVIPQKLLDNGFHFTFPTIKEALQDLSSLY